MRPFLTNKGVLIDNEISLIHNGKTIDDENQVAETLILILSSTLQVLSLPLFLLIQILNFHEQLTNTKRTLVL